MNTGARRPHAFSINGAGRLSNIGAVRMNSRFVVGTKVLVARCTFFLFNKAFRCTENISGFLSSSHLAILDFDGRCLYCVGRIGETLRFFKF